MHRSRIGSVVIDCNDFDAGVRFWREALGVPENTVQIGSRFASLGQVGGGWRVLIQRVPEPKTCKSRVHLDIESDDIDAEVQRLEALGATRVEPFGHAPGWVMTDVNGNEFCVLSSGTTPGWPHGIVEWP
ncbi:MAG TPA: VOC family protein [Actinomycetota bacterium]|nr:VOC family protein [Actinomycetota bacterium]